MTLPSDQRGETHEPLKDDASDDLLEKRGFTWATLVVFMVLTLIGALVLAYLITVHNFPAR